MSHKEDQQSTVLQQTSCIIADRNLDDWRATELEPLAKVR